METTNRFAPPGAQVEDVAMQGSGFQPVRLWPPRGRIGRVRFFAYGVGLYLLFAILMAVVMPRIGSGTTVTLVLFAAYFGGGALIMIQRSHDMDMAGWWSLLTLIPLVGLFWLFKGGTRGVNRWGSPPPPNTWGVVVIAWILPVVFIIGILAAVAIPAYHDYTVRAKAAADR